MPEAEMLAPVTHSAPDPKWHDVYASIRTLHGGWDGGKVLVELLVTHRGVKRAAATVIDASYAARYGWDAKADALEALIEKIGRTL